MIDTQEPGAPRPVIPARTKRQAMDWSLALASQGIAATINRADNGWELIVDSTDLPRAEAVINLYIQENRGWHWRGEVPGVDLVLHWGSLLWVLGIAAIYYWSTVRFPGMKEAGMVNNLAVRNGQWWRLFTAVTLHNDLPHLLSDSTTGVLLLGLAMARFGPGIATLATYLAGVAGNVAGVLIYPPNTESLGASGMVTAALGMISVQSFSHWREYRFGKRLLMRGAAAGILILVLIGFSPESDKVAHVGGFSAGVVAGLALAGVRPELLQRRGLNVIAGLLLGAIVFATWLLASRG